jgi:hypothetical protein
MFMQRSLTGLKFFLLFFLLHFIPSKVIADTGTDFLKNCASLNKQKPVLSWEKFRAGKEKFKASRKKELYLDIDRKKEFKKGYCLGYITASANALLSHSPKKFCPPKGITKRELSLTIINHIKKNNPNALNLGASHLVAKALLNKFNCNK